MGNSADSIFLLLAKYSIYIHKDDKANLDFQHFDIYLVNFLKAI